MEKYRKCNENLLHFSSKPKILWCKHTQDTQKQLQLHYDDFTREKSRDTHTLYNVNRQLKNLYLQKEM